MLPLNFSHYTLITKNRGINGVNKVEYIDVSPADSCSRGCVEQYFQFT
ncbi:hypothetical protein C1O63_0073 [Dehalococcoides mccartyi]|nr:hypothetical protein C1O63_0073 [Dehalococcoides mccartyi]